MTATTPSRATLRGGAQMEQQARASRAALVAGIAAAARASSAAVIAGIMAAALAGCTTLIAPSPAPRPAPPSAPGPGAPAPGAPGEPSARSPQPPSRPQSDARAASTALLEQSRAQRAAGNNGAAAASIERALRIDPNNAALWVELGEIHLAAGDRSQAASMARKALTLTAGDSTLESRAERLLRAASRG
jgi:tetratricopeptide (TPR) repeat protein